MSKLGSFFLRFHEAIVQVTEMSELDRITYFTRRLLSPTREEVQYRRCGTLSQAMKIPFECDRSHNVRGKSYRSPVYSQDRSRASSSQHYSYQPPPPPRAQKMKSNGDRIMIYHLQYLRQRNVAQVMSSSNVTI
ncbi:uncharacterized protein CCR75_008738 [Bremia lactucae]|uniref:Uncharacterized protein n=1 Tax=Bremia lactucae TaxID=4779 RepID=A0A976FQ51_BRELC|nr:hypothetical protein CCR75_008738 [Bremia lactucae]